jgi:hypothetical protein
VSQWDYGGTSVTETAKRSGLPPPFLFMAPLADISIFANVRFAPILSQKSGASDWAVEAFGKDCGATRWP